MMAATMEAFRQSLQGKDGAEITEIAVGLFRAKKELEIQLQEFRNASSAMALEYQQMKDEVKGLRKENENLRKQNIHLTGVQTIQKNDLFGRSTEKTEDLLNHVASEEPLQDPLAEDAREQDTKGIQWENRKRLKGIIPLFGDLDSRFKEKKKRMDLSALPVQNFFDYDIDDLNRRFGEGNWRFAYWKEDRKVELIRRSTYL